MFDIGICHGRVNRQGEDLFIGRFGIWAHSGMCSVFALIKGVEMNREIVHVYADPLISQAEKNGFPVHAEPIEINAHHKQMPGMKDISRNGQRPNVLGFRKRFQISVGDRSSALQKIRQFFQLRTSQSTLNVADSVVKSEIGHFIKPRTRFFPFPEISRDAVVTKPQETVVLGFAVRRHHATLAGCDVLNGMKTEGRQTGNIADPYVPGIQRRVRDIHRPLK